MLKARKAIFLDRDGVINKVLLNNGKPFSPRKFEEFELLPEVEKVLNSFKDIGFINIVITNQPDIARGLMRMKELDKMHLLIRKRLPVEDILVCPHDDIHDCNCRKPKPGMIIEAAERRSINLKKSFLIGDTWKDIEAGKAAGCKTILIDMPYNKDVQVDFRVDGLPSVVKLITDISWEMLDR